MTSTVRVLCLCCGSYYPLNRDCANVDDGRHDAQRAVLVARHLLAQGIEHATPDEIRAAAVALDEADT
jgi:hypothetical protein